MSGSEYGGNRVRRLDMATAGGQLLGSGPYEYFFHRTEGSAEVTFDELGSFTVFVLRKEPNTSITALGIAGPLEQGDCLQAEGRPVALAMEGAGVDLLVAGTVAPHPCERGLSHRRCGQLYKVVKPWGQELWINGQHPRYAFKQIAIKAGTKTSLQYHHFKQETNVLFEGTARLHYKANPDVPTDDVTQDDTASIELHPVSVVDVSPPTLHRLEAVTDILLYETSTPHLDDVVRVQDDSLRPDGRIAEEHPR